MARDRFYYLEGECELEKGKVKFRGVMKAVSNKQAWYYVIYALRDSYDIDYLIDPQISFCKDYEEVFKKNRVKNPHKHLICKFEPYENGEIKYFRKFTEFENKSFDAVDKYSIPELIFEEGNFEDINFDELVKYEINNSVNDMIIKLMNIKNDVGSVVNYLSPLTTSIKKSIHRNDKFIITNIFSKTWYEKDRISLNNFIDEAQIVLNIFDKFIVELNNKNIDVKNKLEWLKEVRDMVNKYITNINYIKDNLSDEGFIYF